MVPRPLVPRSAGSLPVSWTRGSAAAGLLFVACCAAGCAAGPRRGDPLHRSGDEICAAGELLHTGTRVILWSDPGGYDAYSPRCRFHLEHTGPSEAPGRTARFGPLRAGLSGEAARRVREEGWTLGDLKEIVTQVVLHFDACGTSRKCFEVLHDVRGLSCHFLLDLDGTVYQTLDLQERAWHAAQANSFSVGIEIANIGAFPDAKPLAAWYARDAEGTRITLPPEMGGGLPEGFVARPRSVLPVRGRVQERSLVQYDYTEEQYAALEKLLAALCRTFPRVRAEAPRDAGGGILDHVFATDEELRAFHGILGHWHLSREKVDPGPALDWERILEAVSGSHGQFDRAQEPSPAGTHSLGVGEGMLKPPGAKR